MCKLSISIKMSPLWRASLPTSSVELNGNNCEAFRCITKLLTSGTYSWIYHTQHKVLNYKDYPAGCIRYILKSQSLICWGFIVDTLCEAHQVNRNKFFHWHHWLGYGTMVCLQAHLGRIKSLFKLSWEMQNKDFNPDWKLARKKGILAIPIKNFMKCEWGQNTNSTQMCA